MCSLESRLASLIQHPYLQHCNSLMKAQKYLRIRRDQYATIVYDSQVSENKRKSPKILKPTHVEVSAVNFSKLLILNGGQRRGLESADIIETISVVPPRFRMV